MCGDTAEGIELAVGCPPPTEGGEPIPAWRAELATFEMTPKEMQEYDRLERERERRLDASRLHQFHDSFSMAARKWFERHFEEEVRRAALTEVPRAMEFVRPGFDEPNR